MAMPISAEAKEDLKEMDLLPCKHYYYLNINIVGITVVMCQLAKKDARHACNH